MAHVVITPTGDNQGPLLNRVSLAIYTVAVFFVLLRFVTRGCIVRKFGLDDCLIAVALVLGFAQTATILLQVKHGRGRHAKELSISDFDSMLMYKFISMLLYYLANWAVKMSILALYHRIGSEGRGLPWVLRAKVVWSIAAIITAFTVSIVLVNLFACAPVSRAWDVERMQGSCMHMAPFNEAQASINVCIDVLLLAYPMPLLRVLKINTKQRSALVVIFSIGLIPLVASIMRLCEIITTSTPKDLSWLEGDTSWRWAWVPVWSQVEVDVSIVAASLPSLSPLVKQLWSGFAMQRPLTPSQIRTLTKPGEGTGLQPGPSRSVSSTAELNKEKRLTFFDDTLEDEEDVESGRFPTECSDVGVARTVDSKSFVELPKPVRGLPGG